MKDSILRIDCPCCGAALTVDAESGAVLSHTPGRPRGGPKSLDEGLAKLKQQETAREAAFQKGVELNRRKNEDLDRKFAGLLKQHKGRKSDGPPIREFDLD
jgi:hypothetical protein